MSNEISMLKGLTKFVVGVSVGASIKATLKNMTPENVSRVHRIQLGVTTYVLSGMVAEKVTEWAEKEFDIKVEQAKKGYSLISRLRNGEPIKDVWADATKNESETTTEGTEWKSSPETNNINVMAQNLEQDPEDPLVKSPRKLKESPQEM